MKRQKSKTLSETRSLTKLLQQSSARESSLFRNQSQDQTSRREASSAKVRLQKSRRTLSKSSSAASASLSSSTRSPPRDKPIFRGRNRDESLFDIHKPIDLKLRDLPYFRPRVDDSKVKSREDEEEKKKEKEKSAVEPAVVSEVESEKDSEDDSDYLEPDCERIRHPELSLELEGSCDTPLPREVDEDPDTVAQLELDRRQDTMDGIEDDLTPKFAIPPGIVQGVPFDRLEDPNSPLSCFPVDENQRQILAEYKQNSEVIYAHMEDLKDKINEIQKKPNLTKDDGCKLRTYQGELMRKMDELNCITGKISDIMGTINPNAEVFAAIFNMQPMPHDLTTCCPKKKEQKACELTVCETTCEKINNPEQKEDEEVVAPDAPREDPCCPKDGDKEEVGVAAVCRVAFPEVDYPEDKLPRVIVCGNTEEDFPKIVVADSKPKTRAPCIQQQQQLLPNNNASQSLYLHDTLARQNAQLESGKHRLEQELEEKNEFMNSLQRKVCGIHTEMRVIARENEDLKRKIECLQKNQGGGGPSYSPRSSAPYNSGACGQDKKKTCCVADKSPKCPPAPKCPSASCRELKPVPAPLESAGCMKFGSRLTGGAVRSPCGRNNRRGKDDCDVDHRLDAFGSNSKIMGDQLTHLERDIFSLQEELNKVKCDRQQLRARHRELEATKFGDFGPTGLSESNDQCCSQNLRDLKEQYGRLQEDYKSKLCEVSKLRAESDHLKKESREAKCQRDQMEVALHDTRERLKSVEDERDTLSGAKEQLCEQEQALIVAKQRFRDAHDEIEELKTMITDQAAHLDDYRNKFLAAQQLAEEQKRQLDLMEMDNARMNENVTLEINRVKNQFQEKLAQLAPLPDILKQTQVKLQECQQAKSKAEHAAEDLAREAMAAKGRIEELEKQLHSQLQEIKKLHDDKNGNGDLADTLEARNRDLMKENQGLKNALSRVEEQQAAAKKKYDEKQHEISQLTAMLEQVREDSARQVARTKERSEAIKKSMQSQLSDFEMQLAQCRAMARTAQKERDEIRQKMQGQIGNLNDALQQAQTRIRSLQGHVDYLKVSYSNVFDQCEDQDSPRVRNEPPAAGYDSCDCAH